MSDYKIIQDNNNKTIFKIEFAYPNPIIINSLIKTRLIQGATATDDYKIIKFKAVSVTNFTNFTKKNSNKNKITIPITANMVATLSTQLKYLIQHNYTFLGYNLENIIVINDQIFVNLDSELLIDIVENDMAQISSPFSTADFFAAPELLTIKELPSYVHYKVAYFSMAKLILNILNMEDTDESLIKGTKLYHLLSRCLNEDPKTRSILLI